MKKETWKPKTIQHFEPGKPDGEWGDRFQVSRLFLNPDFPMTEGEYIWYQHYRGVQEAILHWVYKKKWNPRHRIPAPRNATKNLKGLEPISDIFLAWLNLCEGLHTLAPSGYVSAGEWFSLIAVEIHKSIMLGCLLDKSDSILVDGVSRDYARDLHSGRNPFCKESEPHQWRAVEAAIDRKDSHPLLYKTLLKGSQRQKPYLGLSATYSAFATFREKGGYPAFELKDGLLTKTSGRGKGRTQILLDSVQKSIAESLS